MKTQVASTSLSTFRELQDSGELQAKEIEVMDLMRKPGIGALTREQIAQRLGWKESVWSLQLPGEKEVPRRGAWRQDVNRSQREDAALA
jgi:hypothetical protein